MLLTAAVPAMAAALNHCSVGAAYMPPATDRGLSSTGSHPPTFRTLPACFAATSPDGEAFLAGFARAKKAPLSKGAGRASGLGDSDGPCQIARYPRRRPGIPPPRLRSAPPFDKGGFPRGLCPRKKAPHAVGSWPSLRGLKGPDGLSVAAHPRAPPANLEGAGCRPPSPLSCAPIHGSP